KTSGVSPGDWSPVEVGVQSVQKSRRRVPMGEANRGAATVARRKSSWWVVPSGLLALVAAGAAFAHHSFTATYFEDQTIKITGTVKAFQFRNPHSFVHVEAPDEDGKMQRWAVEWGGSSQLANQGLA